MKQNSSEPLSSSVILRCFIDDFICPVCTLREYKNVTGEFREKLPSPNLSHTLFGSEGSPLPSNLSAFSYRWLRTVLTLAGVDITVFSAHSTRREFANKAVGVGVKIQAILETADWAAAGTFNIFYNRNSSSVRDCMAFFTGSIMSLGSLQLTNGQPASKSSDTQAKTFRCTILEWLGAQSACKIFLIAMKV